MVMPSLDAKFWWRVGCLSASPPTPPSAPPSNPAQRSTSQPRSALHLPAPLSAPPSNSPQRSALLDVQVRKLWNKREGKEATPYDIQKLVLEKLLPLGELTAGLL